MGECYASRPIAFFKAAVGSTTPRVSAAARAALQSWSHLGPGIEFVFTRSSTKASYTAKQ